MKIKFKKWNCLLKGSTYYDNGRKSLMLVDAEDGQLVAIATVNMVDFECKDDEVFIKDYSENDGIMVQILINHGVILAQHVQEITTPYVTIRSYELNPAIIDEIWKN